MDEAEAQASVIGRNIPVQVFGIDGADDSEVSGLGVRGATAPEAQGYNRRSRRCPPTQTPGQGCFAL
eukprot:12679373-Alexandrium_andersonii.AAC.1